MYQFSIKWFFSFFFFLGGNIALKRITRDSGNSVHVSPTVDGILFGKCLSDSKKPFWNVKFGDNVWVAVVFVLHSEKPYKNKKGLKILVESFNKAIVDPNAGERSILPPYPP